MSIWNRCEKHDALPFYGWPVKPKIKDNIIIFEFPEEYRPNGDKTGEIANKLLKMIGKSLYSVTKNYIKIVIDNDKLAYFIYKNQFNYSDDGKSYK